uniref:CAP-Gly domain-containing protein n=1 Tax=Globisporangium ultimum (strain ATCC 200006 / CBS 805.95 / DAOM BR144) TaxID=431595 RepID=K3WWT3_GLOUD
MASSIPKPRTASFAAHSPTTITIPLDSRVVLSKRRSGWVRYIGKLKNEAGEWYGIALDEGKGENDGTWEKERYFECAPNHGVFVRRKEIFCVKEYPVRSKGPVSPVMPEQSDAGSSTGSSVDSPETLPPPTPTLSPRNSSSSVITPLFRTFKTFRKELGLQLTPTSKANNNSSSSTNASSSPTSSQKAATPTQTKSSGLRSPTNSRFASFSTGSSNAARTATIVSSTLVNLTDKTSESVDQQQRQQQQPSPTTKNITELIDGDENDISSLSDLYRDTSSSTVAHTDTISHPEAAVTAPATTSSPSRTRTMAVAPAPHHPAPSSTRTAVESMRSDKDGARDATEPTPLFFRRANVGSPTIGRRASFSFANLAFTSSSSGSGSSYSSSLGKTSPTTHAANARIVELEKEINVTKINHENIVAVLRATNKQHAVNVLELRAQVAALTEGNNWLEKQLASKNALVAELRQMESKNDDRVPRAEVENIIAIKDAQIQTLEKEILKLKQQVLRIETEKDSILCQQVRHFRARQERDEARINKLREDMLSMCNARTSLQSELQDLKEMTFLF